MCCQSGCTQKLLSCTRSRILQATSLVHLTVVLCDLAYISSEQAMLHSLEPAVVDLVDTNVPVSFEAAQQKGKYSFSGNGFVVVPCQSTNPSRTSHLQN